MKEQKRGCLGTLDILVKEGDMLGTNRKRHSHFVFGKPRHRSTELGVDLGPCTSYLPVTSTYHPKDQRLLRPDTASCLSNRRVF